MFVAELFIFTILFNVCFSIEWTQISTADAANAPSARRDALFLFSQQRNSIFVVGGRDAENNAIKGIYEYSVAAQSWTKLEISGDEPPARFSSVGGIFNNSIYVSSGEGNIDGKRTFFADFWRFDIELLSWTLVQQQPDAAGMETRYGAVGGVVDQQFLVSHGFESGRRFDNTFSFDFSRQQWTQLSTQNVPTARCLGASATGNAQLTMYGGCGSGGYGPCPNGRVYTLRNETWTELDLDQCPLPARMFAAGVHLDKYTVFAGGTSSVITGGASGDKDGLVLKVIDNESGQVHRIRAAGGLASPRSGLSMSGNGSTVFVAFGKGAGGLLADGLWQLDVEVALNDSENVLDNESLCASRLDGRAVHGFIMFLAWGVILPLGAILGREFHHKKDVSPPDLWIQVHRPCQITGVILMLIGVVVVFLSIAAGHLISTHARIGIVVVFLGLLQPLNALVEPDWQQGNTAKRLLWRYLHRWNGRTAIILGLTNIGIGLFLIDAPVRLAGVYFVWVALLAFVLIRGEIVNGWRLNPHIKQDE